MSVTLSLLTWFGPKLSDEALMLRYAQTEDSRLLAELYERCADDLYHFMLSLSEAELAKEMCQQTWLKVIEKKYLYRDSGRFKAWLFTLARHHLTDEYRKNQRLCTLEQIKEPSGPKLSTTHMEKTLAAQFDNALLSLPFEQREAFCLQQEGFGIQEIANITDTPIETIKSRLRYGKVSLKKQLENGYE